MTFDFDTPKKKLSDVTCWTCGGNAARHDPQCKHYRPNLIDELFRKQKDNVTQRLANEGITEANAKVEMERALNRYFDLRMAFPEITLEQYYINQVLQT